MPPHTKDIQFAWKPFKSHQESYFTQEGSCDLAVILFVVVVGGWNVISMRDYARQQIQPKTLVCVFREAALC